MFNSRMALTQIVNEKFAFQALKNSKNDGFWKLVKNYSETSQNMKSDFKKNDQSFTFIT